MAIAPNTTFVANTVLTAAQMNALPFGVVAFTNATSTITATTTETVSITASTFTAIANRYYKITYYESAINIPAGVGANATTKIRITNAAGTQLQAAQLFNVTANAQGWNSVTIAITTLPAGSTVIVGTATVSTGTQSWYRSATIPAQIVVEDIGPA